MERKQKLLERISKSKLQTASLLSDVMDDSANSARTVMTNASDVVRSIPTPTVLERKQLDTQQSVSQPASHTTCMMDTECTQVRDAPTDTPLNDIRTSTSMTDADVLEVTDRHENDDENDVTPSYVEINDCDNTCVHLKSHDSPLHVGEVYELSPQCYHYQIPQLIVDPILPTSDLPVSDSVTTHADATEPDMTLSYTLSECCC